MIYNKCIKKVFEIRDKDWEDLNWLSNAQTKLEKLKALIPESTFFYEHTSFGSSDFIGQIKSLIAWMKKLESKGYVFYTVDDGENNIHCFAIKKEIKNLPMQLSKYNDIFGIDGFYEEVSIGDIRNNLE